MPSDGPVHCAVPLIYQLRFGKDQATSQAGKVGSRQNGATWPELEIQDVVKTERAKIKLRRCCEGDPVPRAGTEPGKLAQVWKVGKE